jgi:hypothetical protein
MRETEPPLLNTFCASRFIILSELRWWLEDSGRKCVMPNGGARRAPAHAGRLPMWERLTIILVLLLVAAAAATTAVVSASVDWGSGHYEAGPNVSSPLTGRAATGSGVHSTSRGTGQPQAAPAGAVPRPGRSQSRCLRPCGAPAAERGSADAREHGAAARPAGLSADGSASVRLAGSADDINMGQPDSVRDGDGAAPGHSGGPDRPVLRVPHQRVYLG